ncbi:MAG: flagellar biosynthetic protein FliR [Lachnospiraceae bacterium]|nr:flagellar biosynthetic protein FliR [Lachnospiraceae bacterium]
MLERSFSFEDLEFFLLIFTRMSCFIVSCPYYSNRNVPRRFKAGFAIVLAYLVYGVTPYTELAYSSIYGYAALVLQEAMCGIIIGIGANICESIVQFAGKIADMEIGLSMVQLFDPSTNEAAGFTGTLYQYGVTLIMMISGMYYYFLRAIIESYTLIPIGGVVFRSEKMTRSIVLFLSDYMSISLRICIPVIMSIMIVNVVLGILVKTAPQINMFSVGIQIKITVGLAAIFLTIGFLPTVSEYIFREMRVMMTAMIESMTP